MKNIIDELERMIFECTFNDKNLEVMSMAKDRLIWQDKKILKLEKEIEEFKEQIKERDEYLDDLTSL